MLLLGRYPAAGTGADEAFLPAGAGLRTEAGVAFPVVGRRMAALGGVLPALLGAREANAMFRGTDRVIYTNKRKLEIVPYFKQSMDYIEKFGIDERLELAVPRMIRKMDLYANIFSSTERPDAVVRKLQKDIKVFEDAIFKKKDKQAAIQAFEQYRLDIPKGTGYFDFNDRTTWEPPAEPVMTKPAATVDAGDLSAAPRGGRDRD